MRAMLEQDATDPDARDTYREMLQWLKNSGVEDELEPDEWEVVQRPLGKLDSQSHINATWRLEGLCMLAWALGNPVVLISNFTEFDHEFLTNCIRITNEKVCHGCWNKPEIKFDKGNWDWCPYNKNFECQTSITAEMVINRISRYF
jgi:hypothetical protein